MACEEENEQVLEILLTKAKNINVNAQATVFINFVNKEIILIFFFFIEFKH